MTTDLKKDVIYVDIEDDITSVIEKVKSSKTSIVALVPPKRIGILQSAVNLKLLQRAATTAKKRVVLITNDQALTGLAAGLMLPVAKNLQSKPQIPSVAAMQVDEEEVIEGADLPVGDLARTADSSASDDTVDTIELPDDAVLSAPFAAKAAARAPKRGSAIPDFDSFRKKLFIFGGLGILSLIFLVWAVFFAGRATVSITAKTNIITINKPLQLRPNVKLDATQGIVPAVVKETKKTSSVDFVASGKKDVGEKATGTMELTRTSISSTPMTVPAGSAFSSGNYTFISTQAVTLAGTSVGSGGLVQDSQSVAVVAAAIGEDYNLSARAYESDGSGYSSQGSQMSGGSKRAVTVVSQSDIDKAVQKIESQDSNKIKAELKKQFDDNAVIISESFAVEPSDPTSAPGLDQEANSAKLTAVTTYRVVGMSRADLRAVYDTYTKSQIRGEKNQKIYESGDESTSFAQFTKAENGYTVRAQATAQVGPNIDDKILAKLLVGKRAGEIQQQIETIQGVEDVAVKFSPFWVTKAPSKAEKITIKFVVQHDKN